MLGGNPAMDYHPIQWGVEILSVASCYRNLDKLWPGGPLGSNADFIYLWNVKSELINMSRAHSDFFLCPTLVLCWLVHFSHFGITELKTWTIEYQNSSYFLHKKTASMDQFVMPNLQKNPMQTHGNTENQFVHFFFYKNLHIHFAGL